MLKVVPALDGQYEEYLQKWQSYCSSRCSDVEISNNARADEVSKQRDGWRESKTTKEHVMDKTEDETRGERNECGAIGRDTEQRKGVNRM